MGDALVPEKSESVSTKGIAELDKLQAETRVIQDQLSYKYNAREWLKAITGIAALGALLWSIITGFDQLQQARQDKQRDALERTLTRLASSNTVERIVGANSVRAFLSGSDVQQRSVALVSLAGAMVKEQDASALSSMLAAFKDAASTPKTDKQYALSILLEGNRDLFAQQLTSPSSQIFTRRLEPQSVKKHLSDLAKAGLLLIRQGATTKDFSRVYCSECDFRGIDLSDSKFDDSFLGSANFDSVNLVSSTFVNAALSNASFRKAKLAHARFSGSFIDSLPNTSSEADGLAASSATPPVALEAVQFSSDFTCADLREANLGGLVFWGISDRGADWELAKPPNFTATMLDKADLSDLNMYVAVPLEAHDELPSLAMKEGIAEARGLNVPLVFRRSESRGNLLVVHGEKVRPSKIKLFSVDQLDDNVRQMYKRHPQDTKLFIVRLALIFAGANSRDSTPSLLINRITETLRVDAPELVPDPTAYGGVRLNKSGNEKGASDVCKSIS